MTELTPSYLEGACTSAQEDRLIADDLICTDGVAKVSDGSLLVVAGAAGITVDVAAGGCFIRGTDPSASQQGTYHCFNDDTVNRAMASNSSGNPRVDQIIARVYDSEYAGSTDAWAIEVLTGTPTSGANLTNLNGAAALPDNSIRLAYVLVPNGATLPGQLTIQDERDPFKFCVENMASADPLMSNVLFNAGGNFTKASYPGLKSIRVRVLGGGGAGGGADATAATPTSSYGAGGGAGGYAESIISASSLADSVAVTVGAGGTGVANAAGGNGSASSFGALVVAAGGTGGAFSGAGTVGSNIVGGSGGTASAGDIQKRGGSGEKGLRFDGNTCSGGAGGSSAISGGGAGRANNGSAKQVGVSADANSGGGGGGASNAGTATASAGGNGGSGVVIVELHF